MLGNYLRCGSVIKFNFRQIPNLFACLSSFLFWEASFTYFTSSPLCSLFCERVVTQKEEHYKKNIPDLVSKKIKSSIYMSTVLPPVIQSY